jgi:autotransporter-associated beta strand protein
LNTHAEADARLRWTSGLDINRNGIQRNIDVGNVVGQTIDAEISGVIQSTAGSTATELRKTGAGTLLLSGNNTYADTFRVAAGRALVSGTNSFTGIVVDSGAEFGGTGSATNAVLSGAGLIGPGNSPGILGADSVNPTGGLDFAFELTLAGAPTWSNAAASGNDVLRLDNSTTPFTSALTLSNGINIYASAEGTFTGGFFTDLNSDFSSSITNATFNFYLQDVSGPVIYNGVNYSLASGSWSVIQIPTADFASGTINNG